MASSVIHMAVANEINKKLKRNYDGLMIGTIAPDISKLIGDSRIKSHFIDDTSNCVPNLERFLDKYKKYLNDDFVMGYYIHLYTDYLWVKYFIENVNYDNMITRIDGNQMLCDRETFIKYVYNDYTNINIKLIDRYKLDLDIFRNELPDIKNIIEEIPMDKLDVVVKNAIYIIKNSKTNKAYLFDIKNVAEFIELAVQLILSDIEKL